MALAVTNNSPTATKITWTGLVIKFKGSNYNITDGNSDYKYLWWDFTNPTVLQEANSLPALTDDDCIVFYNDGGTHYLVPTATIYKGELIEDYGIIDQKLGSLTGWISAQETWTYDGADDPSFTFKVSGDVTTKYSAGMKIKLTQSATVSYYVITKVAYSAPDTTITCYGGNTYNLADGAISDNYYSTQYCPVGFPLSRSVWDLITTMGAGVGSAGANTWYNIQSAVIPIGDWSITVASNIYFYKGGAQGAGTLSVNCYITLSTANNSESSSANTRYIAAQAYRDSGYNLELASESTILTDLVLTAKATRYVNIMTSTGAEGIGVNRGFILAKFNYV